MSNFDNIEGFGGWSDALMKLLEEAEEVGEGASVQDLLKISKRFRDFMRASHPNSEEIRALDAIAGRAATDVLDAGIAERIQSIAGRTTELLQLSKGVEARGQELNQAAASIRLEKATKVVNSLTKSVQALKELRPALENAGEFGEVASAVKDAVERIEKLRNELEQIG